MEWSGKEEFAASTEVPFEVDGSEAGLLTSHGPLSFLKVKPALPSLFGLFHFKFIMIFFPDLNFTYTNRSMMLDTWFQWISLKLR